MILNDVCLRRLATFPLLPRSPAAVPPTSILVAHDHRISQPSYHWRIRTLDEIRRPRPDFFGFRLCSRIRLPSHLGTLTRHFPVLQTPFWESQDGTWILDLEAMSFLTQCRACNLPLPYALTTSTALTRGRSMLLPRGRRQSGRAYTSIPISSSSW